MTCLFAAAKNEIIQTNKSGELLEVALRAMATRPEDRYASPVTLAEDIELDFGATAKALAADRIARSAALASGTGVLVSLGGDVAVDGPVPDGSWPIRVADGRSHRRGRLREGRGRRPHPRNRAHRRHPSDACTAVGARSQ